MATGITQNQVDTAADTLLQAGERPTVERVRAFLGTGSPNTVNRLLDAWWKGLGARVTAQQAHAAVPDAPDAVGALAGQLWQQACQAARNELAAEQLAKQSQLQAEQGALAQERAALKAEQATAQAAVDAARQAQALAEARLVESRPLVEQLNNQLADLTAQRDAATTRAERSEGEGEMLRLRLQAQELAAASEREVLTQHIRATEDRAHAEVDRAREEMKVARGETRTLVHELQSQEKKWQQQLSQATRALEEARHEATTQQARCITLEQQIAKLADLPTELKAALADAQSRPGETTPDKGRRKSTRVSPKK